MGTWATSRHFRPSGVCTSGEYLRARHLAHRFLESSQALLQGESGTGFVLCRDYMKVIAFFGGERTNHALELARSFLVKCPNNF